MSTVEAWFGELYRSEPQHKTPIHPLGEGADDSKPRNPKPCMVYDMIIHVSTFAYLHWVLFFLSLSRRFTGGIRRQFLWSLAVCIVRTLSSPALHDRSLFSRTDFLTLNTFALWLYSNWPINCICDYVIVNPPSWVYGNRIRPDSDRWSRSY